MSTLQKIINEAVGITLRRDKLSSYTITRSGRTRIASVRNNVPWQFTVDIHPAMKYSTNRDLLESLDFYDRAAEQTIEIGKSNPRLGYITQYQGEWSQSQLNTITLNSVDTVNRTLRLDVSGASNAPVALFKAGDLIQPGDGYRYPYTVTEDVNYTSGTTVDVPINRPYITDSTSSPIGATMFFGKDVTWKVLMTNKPGYRIAPYDRVEFTDSFELVEVII